MASYLAKQAVTSQVNAFKSSIGGANQKQGINWDDFNYPPLIKVIHYDINEVEVDNRLPVRALWLSHILIALYSILNIINNIAIAAAGGQGIRILYSFMFFFSFNPIQCFLFYRGYKGICSDKFLLTLYKWLQIVMILCWIAFAIIDVLGFNGFMAVSKLFNDSLVFQGILAICEDISLMLTSMLSTFALIKIWSIAAQ